MGFTQGPTQLEKEPNEATADLAPLAVQAMKQILRGINSGTVDREEAIRLMGVCADSADLQEGLRAHDEGRRPDFEGR